MTALIFEILTAAVGAAAVGFAGGLVLYAFGVFPGGSFFRREQHEGETSPAVYYPKLSYPLDDPHLVRIAVVVREAIRRQEAEEARASGREETSRSQTSLPLDTASLAR